MDPQAERLVVSDLRVRLSVRRGHSPLVAPVRRRDRGVFGGTRWNHDGALAARETLACEPLAAYHQVVDLKDGSETH